jgi:hypothetical protein
MAFPQGGAQVSSLSHELIGELLTVLELAEVRLMEWGFYDVSHSEAEIIQLFEEDPSWGPKFQDLTRGGGASLFVDDLVTAGLLYRIPVGQHGGYRSRFAESIRLMVRLRQRFKDSDWDTARELVSDARFFLKERRFPVRDVTFEKAWTELVPLTWHSSIQKCVLQALMGMPDAPMPLAAFQMRSSKRILEAYRTTDRASGTVVTAGTGGGKTKSFYIPALMGIAADLISNPAPSTKVLAIYPRNVLLADQFSEAVNQVAIVAQALGSSLPRSISVGCLTGDVPFSDNFEKDIRNKKPLEKWIIPQGTRGRRVPNLRDRRTGSSLLWLDQDRLAGKTTLRLESQPHVIAVPDGVLRLTREQLMVKPPDIFLTSIEMINKDLSSELGVKVLGFGTQASALRLVLLDEIHTYEGLTGAQVPWILRRLSFWTRTGRKAPFHVVGLSATLQDAPSHLATLTGVSESAIEEVAPNEAADELTVEGQEYNVVLKSHPGSGAGVFATSIQTVMLGARLLTPLETPPPIDPNSIDPAHFFGRKVFGFTDNLDVVNRWYPDYVDAEAVKRLPRFRNPQQGDDAQCEAGQSWRLCEDLRHNLNSSVRVTRTSSQDPGVDANSTIVLATSALEVGFDDDEVGMVVQHKAPLSAASFLQRKGRAGRRKGMRPWTVVVLSEHGRDRWAFRDSERLFSPHLDRLSVPVFNPYVLRIQATWFLVDWIAKRVGFGVPSLYLARKRHFLPQATQIVEDLLTNESTRLQLTRDLTEWIRFAQGGARVSDPEALATDLLWSPPRSVLRQVLPSLWNHLKGDPSLNHPAGVVPLLPRFLPERTWQVLDTQDVDLVIQGLNEPQSLDINRTLREATPGRVSRRFSVKRRDASKWLAWSKHLTDFPTPTSVAIDALFLQYEVNDDIDGVSIFQPTALELQDVPAGVKKMSNASWQWKCHISPIGDSGYLALHTGPVARSIFEGGSVWMHRERSWLQVYRYSHSFRFELNRERFDPVRGFIHVTTPGNSGCSRIPAVGYMRMVDGIELRVRADLLSNQPALTPDSVASLRPLFLRYLAAQSDVLRQKTSVFQTASLVTSALGMLAATAVRNQLSLKDAWDRIGNKSQSAGKVLSTILVGDIAHESDEISEGDSVQDLVDLWTDPVVAAEMDRLVSSLWSPPEADWSNWLRLVLLETVRSSVECAVQSVLPETPDTDFLIEITDVAGVASIWILEQDSGGIGVIDRLLSETEASPNLFDAALESSLVTCAAQRVALNTLNAVERSRIGDSQVRAAFSDVRNATCYEEIYQSKVRLIEALEKERLDCDKQAVTALMGKALMRGSTENSDRWIRRLNTGRRQVAQRIGLDIDPKIWAYCTVTNKRRHALMEKTLHALYGRPPSDRQITTAAVRLTLDQCADSCADCLGSPREMDGIGASRRLARQWLNLTEVDVTVDAESDSQWIASLDDALKSGHRIKLTFSDQLQSAVSATLTTRLARRIDRGYSLSVFRIASVSRHGRTWELMLRVDDMEAI